MTFPSLKALFTKEVKKPCWTTKIDLTVHSFERHGPLARLPKGLVIGAVPEREDARDTGFQTQVAKFESKLPPGAHLSGPARSADKQQAASSKY